MHYSITVQGEVNELMVRSIHQLEYALFLAHLRGIRKDSGLTQDQVAERLGQTQSFVSKCELGERRIDIVELRAFCQALGVSLFDFARGLEEAILTTEAYALGQNLNVGEERA